LRNYPKNTKKMKLMNKLSHKGAVAESAI
jgi:hypothetical protein